MFRRLLCGLALVVIAGCGGSDDPGVPSATIAPADTPDTTTTSTTEAMTPEEEVEAAYLRSWEVYAEAALSLDQSELDSVYAKDALEIVRADIARFRRDNTPARFSVEHDYTITIGASGVAVVRDDYVNHSVLLDAQTLEPIEPDPNKVIAEVYLLEEVNGRWMVVNIQAPPE